MWNSFKFQFRCTPIQAFKIRVLTYIVLSANDITIRDNNTSNANGGKCEADDNLDKHRTGSWYKDIVTTSAVFDRVPDVTATSIDQAF